MHYLKRATLRKKYPLLVCNTVSVLPAWNQKVENLSVGCPPSYDIKPNTSMQILEQYQIKDSNVLYSRSTLYPSCSSSTTKS